MAWTPIHLSGLAWSLVEGDLDSGSLTVNDSRIVGVAVTSTAGPGPGAIEMPEGTSFRITVEAFAQDNPNPNQSTPDGAYRVTRPAFVWYWSAGGGGVYQPNIAPPFDALENGDMWPAVAGVYEFETASPIEGTIGIMPETGPSVVLYQFGRYEGGFGARLPLPTDFTLFVEVWVDDPGPDPDPAGCFWTNLIGADQECGAAPPPGPSGLAQIVSPQGDGSGYGAFNVYYIRSGSPDESICDPALYDALEMAGENDVFITGIAEIPQPDDDFHCGEPLDPGALSWGSYSLQMTYYSWAAGSAMYYWYNDVDEDWEPLFPNQTWYAVRLNVSGVTYYGYFFLGGGI